MQPCFEERIQDRLKGIFEGMWHSERNHFHHTALAEPGGNGVLNLFRPNFRDPRRTHWTGPGRTTDHKPSIESPIPCFFHQDATTIPCQIPEALCASIVRLNFCR
jgi:hypothetical protein